MLNVPKAAKHAIQINFAHPVRQTTTLDPSVTPLCVTKRVPNVTSIIRSTKFAMPVLMTVSPVIYSKNV